MNEAKKQAAERGQSEHAPAHIPDHKMDRGIQDSHEQSKVKNLLENRHILLSGALVLAVIVVGAGILIGNRGGRPKTSTSTASPAAYEAPQDSAEKELVATAYTGVKEDVLTNQTFDCAPRNDHEWYRTDRTLVVDHKDPNTMYVNIEWKGIYKSTDGGVTWTQKTKGIKVYARSDDKTKGCYSEYPVIAMDPKDNKHLVAGMSGGGGGFLDATTPNSQTGGVYQTFDGGETWKLMINNKMNIYVNDVAFDPFDSKTVYYSTASNPASWGGSDQNKLYVTKGLVYKTSDQGKNWEELPTGIGNRTGATSILINAKNTKELFVPTYSAVRQSSDGTGTGISSGKDSSVKQMGILKTTDGGKTWTAMQPPGGEAIIQGFISPTNAGHMYFAVQSTGGGMPKSYATLDGGQTFKTVPAYEVVSYDPFDPTGNHVYAYSTTAGTPTLPNLSLFESVDGGVSWKPSGKLPKEIKNLNDGKVRPSKIVWHPTDSKTFYMSGAGGLVWKTTDLGQTWSTLLDYTKLPN